MDTYIGLDAHASSCTLRIAGMMEDQLSARHPSVPRKATGLPRGSGSRSGWLESVKTSCNSSRLGCMNASCGSVPERACPFTNSSDFTHASNAARDSQSVKTRMALTASVNRRRCSRTLGTT